MRGGEAKDNDRHAMDSMRDIMFHKVSNELSDINNKGE